MHEIKCTYILHYISYEEVHLSSREEGSAPAHEVRHKPRKEEMTAGLAVPDPAELEEASGVQG